MWPTVRGQHWLKKCIEIKRTSHTYMQTKGAQTWTWSIMCQAFLPEWMNGPVTIGYLPSIVYWHWRRSSHAVHYPGRGHAERDPKRPLIIIPFRQDRIRSNQKNNRHCKSVLEAFLWLKQLCLNVIYATDVNHSFIGRLRCVIGL